MSVTARKTALMPDYIMAMKGETPIVSLTAHTTTMAAAMDGTCDSVLVGDSVGMALHGLSSTLGGCKVQGRDEQRAQVIADAEAVVLEKSP